MIGVELSTSLVLPIDIKTEIFPAPVTEFKEVGVQSCSTHLTLMGSHGSIFHYFLLAPANVDLRMPLMLLPVLCEEASYAKFFPLSVKKWGNGPDLRANQ